MNAVIHFRSSGDVSIIGFPYDQLPTLEFFRENQQFSFRSKDGTMMVFNTEEIKYIEIYGI